MQNEIISLFLCFLNIYNVPPFQCPRFVLPFLLSAAANPPPQRQADGPLRLQQVNAKQLLLTQQYRVHS